MRFQKKFDPFVHCCSCRVITHAIVEENHYLLTQLSPLKVSLIQNIFMKSSFRPKRISALASKKMLNKKNQDALLSLIF